MQGTTIKLLTGGLLMVAAAGYVQAEALQPDPAWQQGIEIMAIGDQENDIAMIEFAGVGVAMDNAIPAVKEAANFITKSNLEDGVAFAIEKYVLA